MSQKKSKSISSNKRASRLGKVFQLPLDLVETSAELPLSTQHRPFYFNSPARDFGHVMIIGPTRMGKSTLPNIHSGESSRGSHK